MDPTRMRRGLVLALTAMLVAACSSSGASTAPSAAATTAPTAAPATPEPTAAPVALSYLVDDSAANQQLAKGLAAAYTAKHPNVTITVESRPGGTEGDNAVKTRLATGDMTDIFWYNSGSLLQALNPAQTLVDLSGEAFIANISESFLPTVTQGSGIFGVPSGTAMGGGILYNKKIFTDNNLQVPKTWAEFGANNEKLKTAGIAPVGATYKAPDTWTSQLFVLADYCNVQAAIPTFAEDYTNNKIKYADTPAALAGFQHLQEGFDKGWYQKDFGSALFADGLNGLATGKFAQYPMLTFALPTIATDHPDVIKDIGFFGQPGADAAKNCATIWMPAATYIPKTTEGDKLAAAKDFLGFIASVEGTEAATATQAPAGPYVIKGSKLPADALPAVLDIQTYLDANAATPALEFLSPVKGPSLEQITVSVGSGLDSAENGAKLYDQDIEKQAKQLGLPRLVNPRLDATRQSTQATVDLAGSTVPIPDARSVAPHHRTTRRALDDMYPRWFYAPGVLLFAVIFIVPTVAAFYFSLTRWTLFDATFIGFDNFAQFVREPSLTSGLRNTFFYAVVTSGLKVVLGLLIATLLTSRIHLRSAIRSIIFFPVLISTVAVGITFSVLMHPSDGLINLTLASVGIDGPEWLSDPDIALLSVALVDVWKGVGIATVIFIAGIVSIPEEYVDAARLEGGAWVKFRHIIIPLTRNATFTVIILSFIGGLRTFDLIWTMTRGGPGFSTDTIASTIYKQYQAGFYGLATAGNVILFIIVMLLVYPMMRFFAKREIEL